MIVFALNLAATFGVFAAVVWRLRICRSPTHTDVAGLFQWWSWFVVHMAVALPCLMLLGESIETGRQPPWYLIVMKFGLTVMLLAPWKRREDDLK